MSRFVKFIGLMVAHATVCCALAQQSEAIGSLTAVYSTVDAKQLESDCRTHLARWQKRHNISDATYVIAGSQLLSRLYVRGNIPAEVASLKPEVKQVAVWNVNDPILMAIQGQWLGSIGTELLNPDFRPTRQKKLGGGPNSGSVRVYDKPHPNYVIGIAKLKAAPKLAPHDPVVELTVALAMNPYPGQDRSPLFESLAKRVPKELRVRPVGMLAELEYRRGQTGVWTSELYQSARRHPATLASQAALTTLEVKRDMGYLKN